MKQVFGIPVIAALCALTPTPVGAQPSSSGDIPSANAFNPIQRYDIAHEKPRDAGEFYLRDFGVRSNQANYRTIAHPEDRSMRVMLITVEGIRDDAVEGLQLRLGLRFDQEGWMAQEAGMRRRCYRGEDAGNWTRAICP